jgi:Receptor L domain
MVWRSSNNDLSEFPYTPILKCAEARSGPALETANRLVFRVARGLLYLVSKRETESDRAQPKGFKMFFTTRNMLALATLAIAASACTMNTQRSARVSTAPIQCLGSVVHNADEANRYTGCTAVRGDLRIVDSQLTTLAAFETLERVSGRLVIATNPRLESLDGLEQLSSVGQLEIRNNAKLENLRGLSALGSATTVQIQHNGELCSLRGLEGLERVERLEIVNNAVFETSGLANLRAVGELTIADNSNLISLAGLNGLTHAGSVRIHNNPLLCARMGLLPKLAEVDQRMDVDSNYGLSRSELEELREHVKLQIDQRSAESGGEVALH